MVFKGRGSEFDPSSGSQLSAHSRTFNSCQVVKSRNLHMCFGYPGWNNQIQHRIS